MEGRLSPNFCFLTCRPVCVPHKKGCSDDHTTLLSYHQQSCNAPHPRRSNSLPTCFLMLFQGLLPEPIPNSELVSHLSIVHINVLYTLKDYRSLIFSDCSIRDWWHICCKAKESGSCALELLCESRQVSVNKATEDLLWNSSKTKHRCGYTIKCFGVFFLCYFFFLSLEYLFSVINSAYNNKQLFKVLLNCSCKLSMRCDRMLCII